MQTTQYPYVISINGSPRISGDSLAWAEKQFEEIRNETSHLHFGEIEFMHLKHYHADGSVKILKGFIKD